MEDAAIPSVDLSRADALRTALTEYGFMYVREHGIDPALIARAFATSQRFFAEPRIVKDRFAYTDVDSNFGYQGIEVERLDPASMPDLKESFTMRNLAAVAPQERRWPPAATRSSAPERTRTMARLRCSSRTMSAVWRCAVSMVNGGPPFPSRTRS